MADIEKEESQDSQIDRTGLENLPDKERAETEEILGEISKGGAPDTGPDAGKEKPEGEEIPLESKPKGEPDDKAKPTEEATHKPRREASVVPAWKLKVAEDQKQHVEKELADLKVEQEKALQNGDKPTEVAAETDKRLEALAEKTGMDVDTLRELGTLFAPKEAADPKLKETLEYIERSKQETASAQEVAQFSADFDQDILPLVKKEYGDAQGNVPPETVTRIKDALAKIAYTPEYAKVPYEEIYLGKKDFRGVIPPAAKGAEHSRGGTARVTQDTTTARADGVDWDKLASDSTYAIDDEALKALSGADLDKYFAIVDKRK